MTGCKIVIRPYPQSITSEKEKLDGLREKYPQIEWNSNNDNFDILNRSDLLISDFFNCLSSSALFDFENVLESGIDEELFTPEYFERLADVKLPATKLELLIKMLKKQIQEFGKTNGLAAKTFQEMLQKTIDEYHERRKHLDSEEAGETQEQATEDIIKNATEQALAILKEMNENRESFRKMGLTFEEKAFYDILLEMRDKYNFEYGEDKTVDGVVINDKCKVLAKKVKEIIDTKSSFADWLNNVNVRNQLKLDIKICLVKNGYPPQYSPEVFSQVMEQVENFEENSVN